MKNPLPIKSRIWIGTYNDMGRGPAHLGWLGPEFIDPSGNTTLSMQQRKMLSKANRSYYPGDLYRCEITIRPVKNKRGKYIVRRNKKKNAMR